MEIGYFSMDKKLGTDQVGRRGQREKDEGEDTVKIKSHLRSSMET